MPLVYSTDRVRRLRLVLLVDSIAGVLLALLGVFVAVNDDSYRRLAVVVGVCGLVVLAASVLALRSLLARDRRARITAIVAGLLTVVVGFLFAKMILGFAMILIGLVIVVLAVLRDDPDLVT